jgi:hypothetical protein
MRSSSELASLANRAGDADAAISPAAIVDNVKNFDFIKYLTK